MNNDNQPQAPESPQAPQQPVEQPQFQPQPQPQFQPQQPQQQYQPQQPQPVGTSYNMQPQSGSAPKNNKKLFLWIGIAAGALLLIGATIAIIMAIFVVSKDDYRKAYGQMIEVSTVSYDLNSASSSIQYGMDSSTDTKFKNDVESTEKAIEKIRQENKKLADFKAVKFGEGKVKYEAFSKKLDEYLTFNSGLLTSATGLREASVSCESATNESITSVTSAKNAIDECVSALKKVDGIPNEDMKVYSQKLVTEFDKLSSLIGELAQISDPYGAQYEKYKSIRDQVYDVQDNVSDAETDFRSNLEKHAKDADIKNSADEFLDFLDDKIRG